MRNSAFCTQWCLSNCGRWVKVEKKIMKRVVITGPPGSGKSRLLLELGNRGFRVMPETYRWLRVLQAIETEYKAQLHPFKEDLFLLHTSLQQFIEDQPSSDTDGYCFFDRSMIDILAYCRAYQQTTRLDMALQLAQKSAKNLFYAFLLPVPRKIEQDSLRKEGIEEARRLSLVIQDTYQLCGVDLKLLNAVETSKRVDEVISWLRLK